MSVLLYDINDVREYARDVISSSPVSRIERYQNVVSFTMSDLTTGAAYWGLKEKKQVLLVDVTARSYNQNTVLPSNDYYIGAVLNKKTGVDRNLQLLQYRITSATPVRSESYSPAVLLNQISVSCSFDSAYFGLWVNLCGWRLSFSEDIFDISGYGASVAVTETLF